MVFSSPLFLFVFLPLTLGIYYLTPLKLKNLFLLIASLFFYAWGEGAFVTIMLVSIGMNFLTGIKIAKSNRKKLWLGIGIVGNLSLLIYFKYINFIVANINQWIAGWDIGVIPSPEVRLPIGISFFTFQAMSYIIDVYRGTTSVQKNLVHLGLYIALFPQLIAGPILRYHNMAQQLIHRTIGSPQIAVGIQRFVFGLAKKVLIANVLAEVADQIFALSGPELGCGLAWLGIICYALQIYFDFSGYSDMALGIGSMLGFRFPENFNYPYISVSIKEFWRRWHITLSTWFRDYLYIPLGGNRGSNLRTAINLLVVFFLCGLWHGASWNFIVWGLIHGLFLSLERSKFGLLLARAPKFLGRIYVISVVLIGWVFFRAETLPEALAYLSTMFHFNLSSDVLTLLNPERVSVLIFALLFSTPIYPVLRQKVHTLLKHHSNQVPIHILCRSVQDITLIALFLLAAAYISAGHYNPFIYFRF